MFVYYNVIWIIFIILLFLSLCMFFGRKRVRQANIATAQYGNPDYVIVDMNGRQTYQPTRPATYAPPPPTQPTSSSQQQQFYRPPEQNPVEPPPPSYQDYSKDYRVQHLQ